MNTKTDKLLTIILFLLALHLLYSNSLLLQKLVKAHTLVVQTMAILFGLSYSLITVLVIAVYPRWYVFTFSALLDGTAVLLKYFPFDNETTFFVLTAVYFSLYTGFIVVISGIISQRQKQLRTLSSNGKVSLEKLQQERARIKWSLDRTKNEQSRQQKIKQLEEIDRLIKALQN